MNPRSWVIFLLLYVDALGQKTTPKGVVIVYRHGERTPIDPYKSDPWGDRKHWPVPFEELTPRGMLQMYQLGKELRKLYGHLLGDVFDRNEIYVRSSDIHRTLMAAECNLAGLYPTKKSDRFDPDLPWRPSAIHTVPRKEDTLILTDSTCPLFLKKRNELFETEYFQNLIKQYEWLRQYVGENTEENFDATDFKKLSYIYDTLKIEEDNNLTLPTWTQKVYPYPLLNINNITFAMDTFTPLLTRLVAGPLAKKITEDLISIEKGEITKKVFIYSAHDTNIANLLSAMNLLKFEIPTYASNLIFELISNGTKPSVRVLYKMKELSIPNCGRLCPLTKWVELHSHLFPNDYDAECSLGDQITNDQTVMIFSLLIFFMAILLLLITITGCIIHRTYNNYKLKQSPLNF